MVQKLLLFVFLMLVFSMFSIPSTVAQSVNTSFKKYDKNGIQVDFPDNWETIRDTETLVVFKTMIPPDRLFTADIEHSMVLSLTILPIEPNVKLSDVQSHIINQMIPERFGHNIFLENLI